MGVWAPLGLVQLDHLTHGDTRSRYFHAG
jgi:hypothetical protein